MYWALGPQVGRMSRLSRHSPTPPELLVRVNRVNSCCARHLRTAQTVSILASDPPFLAGRRTVPPLLSSFESSSPAVSSRRLAEFSFFFGAVCFLPRLFAIPKGASVSHPQRSTQYTRHLLYRFTALYFFQVKKIYPK